jgi:hypothetical protein
MRLPQDLANLLAIAIRDAVWFQNAVAGFLTSSGVHPELMKVVVQRQRAKVPTVKIVHELYERLDAYGEAGEPVLRKMLTDMYYWNDLHSIPPDRKPTALSSLQELRKAYDRHKAQREFQEQRERQMHSQRVERTALSSLDHAKLQRFRDEFDVIHQLSDRQERGNRLQDLLNKILQYYSERSLGAFNRTGEQIDATFYFDKHWYYVEIRWKEQKANAADVSVLRDRAKDAYGGDTKALFISFNGFTHDCLNSLSGKSDERVILMDGVDLRDVLDCAIAFDVLLAEKQAEMIQNKRAFISSREIIARRATR